MGFQLLCPIFCLYFFLNDVDYSWGIPYRLKFSEVRRSANGLSFHINQVLCYNLAHLFTRFKWGNQLLRLASLQYIKSLSCQFVSSALEYRIDPWCANDGNITNVFKHLALWIVDPVTCDCRLFALFALISSCGKENVRNGYWQGFFFRIALCSPQFLVLGTIIVLTILLIFLSANEF